MEDKNFNSIDMFKLIMAVVVVAIHTNPIVGWTNRTAISVVMTIEEWAVPFFFTASGFFLFNTMKRPYIEGIRRIDKYTLKIIVMYCAWTLISLPLTIYGYVISGDGILSCILSYVKYFLFVGKLYNSYHLWYLLSLIYALFAIRVMVKRKASLGKIMCISTVVFLFSELMSVLLENPDTLGGIERKFVLLYEDVFNNGGVFTGLIYVSAGMLIAHFHLHINKYRGMAVLLLINILKLFLTEWGYDAVADLIMPIEAMLLFMLLLDIKLPDNKRWVKCRKASTVIYLSHLIFFSIYTFLIIRTPNKLGPDSFIVTVVLSLLNAVLLITAQERGHFKLLRYII